MVVAPSLLLKRIVLRHTVFEQAVPPLKLVLFLFFVPITIVTALIVVMTNLRPFTSFFKW
mgnify:CR=1 FL=1